MTVVTDKTTFQKERYTEVIDDIKPLLVEHWRELATYQDIRLDPEYEFYRKSDELGLLHIYTVREQYLGQNHGDLIGYSIFFVRPSHHHYAGASWAMNDIVWIRSDRRQVGLGRQFVSYWDADLKKRGVDVVNVRAKVAQPALAFLLKDCGYEVIEAGYEKRLT
jgi:hypothetical protein